MFYLFIGTIITFALVKEFLFEPKSISRDSELPEYDDEDWDEERA